MDETFNPFSPSNPNEVACSALTSAIVRQIEQRGYKFDLDFLADGILVRAVKGDEVHVAVDRKASIFDYHAWYVLAVELAGKVGIELMT